MSMAAPAPKVREGGSFWAQPHGGVEGAPTEGPSMVRCMWVASAVCAGLGTLGLAVLMIVVASVSDDEMRDDLANHMGKTIVGVIAVGVVLLAGCVAGLFGWPAVTRGTCIRTLLICGAIVVLGVVVAIVLSLSREHGDSILWAFGGGLSGLTVVVILVWILLRATLCSREAEDANEGQRDVALDRV
eukprot:TRINITY_DN2421_c0_g1_i1.p1 TRINITY_DN2421_c0_g1~~TRINITY_DN2421_c0_g1_i1.p1  ORF type:complete len:187 (+),score=40.15 TRINITY_DN2421_c0_g1_i1:51-611(+)